MHHSRTILSSTLTSKVPGYSWWIFCARIMSISDLTFPAVVSLCRIEREAMDGFVLKEDLHVTSPYLCCVATYNREKSATSTFNMDICPVCLVLVLGVGHLMRDSEFLFYGLINRVCAVLDHCVVVLISAHRFHRAS